MNLLTVGEKSILFDRWKMIDGKKKSNHTGCPSVLGFFVVVSSFLVIIVLLDGYQGGRATHNAHATQHGESLQESELSFTGARVVPSSHFDSRPQTDSIRGFGAPYFRSPDSARK